MEARLRLVSISRRARRITLQRFLLSKLFYGIEKFTVVDLYALFLNQIWLEQKCATDEEFLRKFGRDLESLSIILKEINFRADLTDRALIRLRRRCKDQLEDFLFPKRNYAQIEKLYKGFVQPIDESLALLDRGSRRISKRRMGIGYRDKGTLKNLAKDGSPSWQEVAMHRGSLYDGEKFEKKKSFPADNSTEKVKIKIRRAKSWLK